MFEMKMDVPSVEVMTTHRGGGGAVGTTEPMTTTAVATGDVGDGQVRDEASPKPPSHFAIQQDQILQEIEQAVTDMETKLSTRRGEEQEAGHEGPPELDLWWRQGEAWGGD